MSIDPTPVLQAKHAFDHKEGRDKEWRVNMMIGLAEWGIFSNSHISAFTGMRPADVGAYTKKRDKTGGKLPGESLEHILQAIYDRNAGEVNDLVILRARQAGAGFGMMTRLTGIPETTLKRSVLRVS